MDNEILYSPDVVEFIIRKDTYYEQYLLEHPGLITSKTIIGTYIICYAKVNDYNEMSKYMGSDFVNTISSILGLTDRPSLEASGITSTSMEVPPFLHVNLLNNIFFHILHPSQI